jgi:stage V sporulation protein D (sporulation-specific penicillin-binding protein)
MKVKFWFIRIGFLCIFFGLLAYVYKIQIMQGGYYAQRAEAQAEAAANTHNPTRGVLYFTDKNNNAIPAVINKEYPLVYAVPVEIENPAATAAAIAPLFDLKEADLVKSFSKPKDEYELIAEKADAGQVEKLRNLKLPGIYFRSEAFRFYQYGNMAAHLLGYISAGSDGAIAGRYGVELQYNRELRDKQDIHLTIDPTVQAEGEKLVKNLLNEWGAQSATFIVQEPFSGKVLAMANFPSFDPNAYSEYPIASFLNPAVESVYEPGSVFKMVTMAAGLDAEKFTPETTYKDTGSTTLNGRKIQNWDLKAHGVQTMRQVIEKSLNTGTIFMQRRMGNDIFREYVKKFGFGEKTGVELPGEVGGNIKNLSSREDVNYATASFGQGVSVTPLQMITAASAIANGGVLMKPLIRTDEEQEVIRRVISKETADTMTNVLVGAVDANVLAAVPQYKVAGKTGTAFIPNFGKGGYTDDVINTYIGYAPASKPKFTILIKLVKPRNAPLAGQTVVPAFKKLTEFLLNYYQIAPDRLGQ